MYAFPWFPYASATWLPGPGPGRSAGYSWPGRGAALAWPGRGATLGWPAQGPGFAAWPPGISPWPGAFPGAPAAPYAPEGVPPAPVVAPDIDRPGGPLLRLGQPDRWEDWRRVPGSSTDAAPAVVSAGGRLLLARKAPDGQVYVAEQEPGGAWTAWTPVPGARTALRPALAAPGETVYLFFTGPGGQVMAAVRSGGQWLEPVAFTGQTTVSPPGALAMDGDVFLFVRGAGDLVHYTRLPVGAEAWTAWQPIRGMETDDQPVPVVYPGRLTVFIHGKEGHHWYNTLEAPDRWLGWRGVPRRDPSYVPPGPVVYRGDLWLFGQFPDFTVWFIATADGFNWRTWREVPLIKTRSAPAPVVDGGRLYLFCRGEDDTVVYTIRRS